MIEEGQIRRFKSGGLPDIKVNNFSEDKNKWICILQEDLGVCPYMQFTTEKLESDTELVGYIFDKT